GWRSRGGLASQRAKRRRAGAVVRRGARRRLANSCTLDLEGGAERGDGGRRVAYRLVHAAQFFERHRRSRELDRLLHVAIVQRCRARPQKPGQLRVVLLACPIQLDEVLGRSQVQWVALEG